jgi:hypothetical protein
VSLPNSDEQTEYFIFRVTNNSLKEINFTVDFRESENILVGLLEPVVEVTPMV